MFERFTNSARRAVVLSHSEAQAARQPRIGAEQLLIGAVTAEQSSAGGLLATVGIDVEGLRAGLIAAFGRGDTDMAGHIPFADDAKLALENAFHESNDLGHTYISTEHLLLGLLRADGIGAVFDTLGVPPDRVREATMVRLASEQGNEPAEP